MNTRRSSFMLPRSHARIAIIALGLCLALVGDSFGQSQQPSPRQGESIQPLPARSTLFGQSTPADQRGTEQSPVIVKVIPPDDERQKVAAEENLVWATNVLSAIALLQLFVFGWQGFQLKRSVDVAHLEFVSTHRPRIILRDVWMDPDKQKILYMLVNIGDTKARMVESLIHFELMRRDQFIRPLRSQGHDDLKKLTFAAGEIKDLAYKVPGERGAYIMVPDMMRIGIEDKPPMSGDFYFTGAIIYSDDAGTKRRSVFRRRWDHSQKSFCRLDDPDQEYAD